MAENPFHVPAEDASRFLAGERHSETQKACNIDERDHVHVARVGDAGAGLEARGLVMVHEGGALCRVFLAAPELRHLASALLNVADAIDGVTPLTFFPPAPETDEPNSNDEESTE